MLQAIIWIGGQLLRIPKLEETPNPERFSTTAEVPTDSMFVLLKGKILFSKKFMVLKTELIILFP